MRPCAGAGLGWFAYRSCEAFLELELEVGDREQFHRPMSTNGAQKYGDAKDSCSPVTALLICLRMVWRRASRRASALERPS